MDSVEFKLVQSLARPGGNITGVTTMAPSVVAKRFELVRELLPSARRIAILRPAANDFIRLLMSQEGSLASRDNLQVASIEVLTREDVPGAIEKAKALGVDVVVVSSDPNLTTPPNRVPELMAEARLPAIDTFRQPVQAGGLMAYSPDFTWIARRHTQLVNSVLRGTPPADVPVEEPTKYDLVINLKTANAHTAVLLAQADEVIE